HGGWMDRTWALLEAAKKGPTAWKGLAWALGWVSFAKAEPQLKALLRASEPAAIRAGLFATALHLRDPGEPLRHALESPDLELRATALRVAAKLGIAELAGMVRWHFGETDPACRFWSAAALTLF